MDSVTLHVGDPAITMNSYIINLAPGSLSLNGSTIYPFYALQASPSIAVTAEGLNIASAILAVLEIKIG